MLYLESKWLPKSNSLFVYANLANKADSDSDSEYKPRGFCSFEFDFLLSPVDVYRDMCPTYKVINGHYASSILPLQLGRPPVFGRGYHIFLATRRTGIFGRVIPMFLLACSEACMTASVVAT